MSFEWYFLVCCAFCGVVCLFTIFVCVNSSIKCQDYVRDYIEENCNCEENNLKFASKEELSLIEKRVKGAINSISEERKGCIDNLKERLDDIKESFDVLCEEIAMLKEKNTKITSDYIDIKKEFMLFKDKLENQGMTVKFNFNK